VADEVTLEITDLHSSVEGTQILRGVTLRVGPGEVHALMGPNGSGKSTLANTLAGHPRYEVTGGSVRLGGEDLLAKSPDERARAGLFLAFQYPVEVPGVTVANFIHSALKARGQEIPFLEFRKRLLEKISLLEWDEGVAKRYLNEGFSGGERKRNEILQMAMLEPRIAIMDETDSGLDVDSIKIVSNGVNSLRGDRLGILVITHYERILRYIQPDFVHVMYEGRIVRSAGPELVDRIEREGYDWIKEEVAAGRGGV
jgi:Fe-S cluster assembly ATP-binding protein